MTEWTEYGAKYPEHEFSRVVVDFSLDAGERPKRSGYRPLWWIATVGANPNLVGMCEMTVIGAEWIQPGETLRAAFVFVPGVQGYIERLVPGDEVEIREGGHRVGSARIVEFVY